MNSTNFLGGPYLASTTTTMYVNTPEVKYAYRKFGNAGARPLVLVNRFHGTMDDWDPALMEVLASDHTAYLFDSAGIGSSSGITPRTMAGMAQAGAAFMDALGLKDCNVMGFSQSGMVAQQLALDRPDLVHKLIVAGSGSGYLENAPKMPTKVWEVADTPVNIHEDFLDLFFHTTDTSRAGGRAHLSRLKLREDAQIKPVTAEAMVAQRAAAACVGTFDTSLHRRLARLRKPVLVANGSQDIMLHPYNSYTISQAIPHAKLLLYSDASHGFLFQSYEKFGLEVLDFLI